MNLLITRKAAEIAFGLVPDAARWRLSMGDQIMFELVDEHQVEAAKYWHDIQPVVKRMIKPRISSARLEMCLWESSLTAAGEVRIPLG